MAAVNAAVPVAALVHAVAGHARQRPGATALVWGERQVSYGELWAAALRAGERIRSLHLPPTAAIGLRVDKTPDAVALVLGALASGHPFLLPSTGNPAPLLDRCSPPRGVPVCWTSTWSRNGPSPRRPSRRPGPGSC